MYELEVRSGFSSAHRLNGYQGDCSALHGHNWSVSVVVQAQELDAIGIAIDFRELKERLAAVIAAFDHKYLNDLPEFQNVNPTSERLAKIIFERLAAGVDRPGARVAKVGVMESDNTMATYFV